MTRYFFEEVMTARAIENTIYLLYSNMVGVDARMDFWGGGAIIGPRGETIAKGQYFEESSIKGTIDPELLSSARRNRPTIRDARPSIFRELARLDEIGRPQGP
jgi:predicted amidohydrolase